MIAGEEVINNVPLRTTNEKSMRYVVISDTHNLHQKLTIPSGDVLIHCGDFTNKGSSMFHK